MIGFDEHISAIVEPKKGHSDAVVFGALRKIPEVKGMELLAEGLISVSFKSPLNNQQFADFAQQLNVVAHVAKKTLKEPIRRD